MLLLDPEDEHWRDRVYLAHGYYVTSEKPNRYVHRLIKGCVGVEKTDHKSGDTGDNRKGNLRCVPNGLNVANLAGAKRHSKSGVLGVYPCNRGKWCPQIRKDGVVYHIGTFPTVDEATAARILKEKELWGDCLTRRLPAYG